MKVVLACDLGGTRVKYGIVHQGKVLAFTVEPAKANENLLPQLPAIKAMFHRMLEELGLSLKDCIGISISFPSIVDVTTGKVLAEFGKFSDAPALDLVDWAKAELGLPLVIENDARMAMIGEHHAGAGKGCANLAMITLGTGLGVSALIEGKVLRGKHGQAGILGGHLSVQVNGRPCICGNLGCAESESSATYLNEIAITLPDWDRSSLKEEPSLDYKAVFKHASKGDACATYLRDRSLRIWATLAVSLIHVYDPEIVIFGGGIMAASDQIIPFIQNFVREYANTPWGLVRVLSSKLGDEAALIAGEWLLYEKFPELKS